MKTNGILRSHAAIVRTAIGAIGTVLVLVSCSSDTVEPEPSYPATLDVFTPGSIFSPPTAEIRVGGTIRFIITEAPDGDGHNANFVRTVPGVPPDVPVLKDTTVTRKFDTRGTFPYVCTVHPGMTGEVIVH